MDTHLLLQNSHNGSSQVIAAVTPVRVVCQNTLTWALNGAKLVHKVRHTKNLRDKLAEAKAVFDLTQTYMTAFERDATRLMYTPMNDVQWEEFLGKLIVIPEKKAADKDGRSRTMALNKHADLTSIGTTSPRPLPTSTPARPGVRSRRSATTTRGSPPRRPAWHAPRA